MSNSADEIVTVETPSPKRRCGWGKAGILFTTLGMIIFVCAFGYGYFQLAKVNISLAHMVTDLQKQAQGTQDNVAGLQKSIEELQQSAQKSQALSERQESMIADWQASQKGDLNKWYVAEAQYLTRLASDHVQFSYNITMAITLLQRADQVLEKLNDTGLLEIRKAIATDIATLQALPQVDVTQLYVRLVALNNQLDQLPLPVNPLKAETQPVPAAPADQANLSWWKKGLNQTEEALRKIVIVRKSTANALPLVMPEEKIFFYQNLHAQMESAMWAVLHRNADVYQASLNRMITWIQQYFAQDAAQTKTVLDSLRALQAENIQPPTATNLSATLQLFDTYAAQSTQPAATAQ